MCHAAEDPLCAKAGEHVHQTSIAFFLQPLLPLFGLSLASWIILMKQRAKVRRGEGARAKDQTANALQLLDARYDALLSKVHFGFEIVGVSMIAHRMHLWQTTDSPLVVGTVSAVSFAIFVLGVAVTVAVLHRVTSSLAVTERTKVYRIAYAVSEVIFRLQRLIDLFTAPDRALFVRVTARTLMDKYADFTTWSCFAGGLFMGIIQPGNQPRTGRHTFLCFAFASPLLPAGAGWLVTGDAGWLLTCVRLILWPYVLGYLVEHVQRHLIKEVLTNSMRNELAMELAIAEQTVVHPFQDADMANDLEGHGFDVLGILGRGSSGDVYLVSRRRPLVGYFAMKRISRGRLSPVQIARALEEAAILRCIYHPYIVRLEDTLETPHSFYLTMTYAGGGDLTRWLESFSVSSARLVIAEVLLALEYLHSKSIIYRDVKLENTLVSQDGHALLSDFGVSKRLSQAAGAHVCTETIVGTPGYMPPELAMTGANGSIACAEGGYSFYVDFWASAVMLHEMLTNHSTGSNQQPEIRDVGDGLMDSEAHHLLTGLLTPDRRRRLGCGASGIADIKAHPYFESVDWNALLGKEVAGPLLKHGSKGPTVAGKLAIANGVAASANAVRRPTRSTNESRSGSSSASEGVSAATSHRGPPEIVAGAKTTSEASEASSSDARWDAAQQPRRRRAATSPAPRR